MDGYDYELQMNYYNERIDKHKENIKNGCKIWSKEYSLQCIKESKKEIKDLKTVESMLEDR